MMSDLRCSERETHMDHGFWWIEEGVVRAAHCHGKGRLPDPPAVAMKPVYQQACPQCGEPFTNHGGETLECPV